jgi:hypothetical protein
VNPDHETLIVTAEEVTGAIAARVAEELRGRRAFLVSPALAESGLKHQMGDIDEAIGPARERLETSLGALRDAGVEADGEVGDSDPVQAISDELNKRGNVDRVLLISHASEEDAAYAEKELLDRVEANIEAPVTELRVGEGAGGQRVEDKRRGEAAPKRAQEGKRVSANLPPLRSRDALGLMIGIVGTIVLIVLAGGCEGGPSKEGLDACAVKMLIAGGAFLINLGHVGALLLMESVKYRGPFERFFSRLSLYGTPLAIVASLLAGPLLD